MLIIRTKQMRTKKAQIDPEWVLTIDISLRIKTKDSDSIKKIKNILKKKRNMFALITEKVKFILFFIKQKSIQISSLKLLKTMNKLLRIFYHKFNQTEKKNFNQNNYRCVI